MDIITTIQENYLIFLIWISFVGLVVGSFLNVLIHRIPVMMNRESHLFCQDFLGPEITVPEDVKKTYNLVWPLSQCPQCKKCLQPWHNIPIISYLFLKGRCAYCKIKISIRYPLVELACCLSSLFIAYHLGFSVQTLAALFFTWILIVLFFIDIDHQLLPDVLTLLLLWAGLFASLLGVFVTPSTAIIGAIAGYMVFWFVANLFKLIARKEGMGYGDLKLLAALGAWLGWQSLPLVIIVSSAVGLLATLLWAAIKRKNMKGIPIPFGPYLVIAGWIGLFWGSQITRWYFEMAGIL